MTSKAHFKWQKPTLTQSRVNPFSSIFSKCSTTRTTTLRYAQFRSLVRRIKAHCLHFQFTVKMSTRYLSSLIPWYPAHRFTVKTTTCNARTRQSQKVKCVSLHPKRKIPNCFPPQAKAIRRLKGKELVINASHTAQITTETAQCLAHGSVVLSCGETFLCRMMKIVPRCPSFEVFWGLAVGVRSQMIITNIPRLYKTGNDNEEL